MRRFDSLLPLAGLAILLGTPCVGRTASAGSAAAADTAVVRQVFAPAEILELTPPEWDAFHLARAVDLWYRDDLNGAASELEKIDVTPASPFFRADRAAFLLAVIYMQLDDRAAFRRVAERAGSADGSAWRRWIRYCQLVQSARGGATEAELEADVSSQWPDDIPGGGMLVAALLIEAGRPEDAYLLLGTLSPEADLASIHLYLRALARMTSGDNHAPDWQDLSQQDPKTPHEADLVAAALIHRAEARLERDGNARNILERVPEESRYAAYAQHMLALLQLESGDVEGAERMLVNIVEEYPEYEARADIELTIGGFSMDRGLWKYGLAAFESAERHSQNTEASLAAIEDDAHLDDVWRVWEEQNRWRSEVRLAPDDLFAALAEHADDALDLRDNPTIAPDANMAKLLWPAGAPRQPSAAWDVAGALLRYQPTPEEWASLRSLQRRRRDTSAELARAERRIGEMERDIQRHLAFLQRGYDDARSSADELARATAQLEGILARLDGAALEMAGVRDNMLEQIASRTEMMAMELERQRIFMEALRHFHVDGPRAERPEEFPAGVPDPGDLLAREDSLAQETQVYVARFADHYTALIARSYDEVWEPRLTGRSRGLYRELLFERDRANRIGAEIDSAITAFQNDPALLAERHRRDELSAEVTLLRRQEDRLRSDVAHAVAARGREQLFARREAIDYHLADATYEIAIDAQQHLETAADSAAVVPLRRRALYRLAAFAERYPQSIARGETRFRLADLRLMQARDDFQMQMAEFLQEDPSATEHGDRALAPFVDYAPVITLYRSILAEDKDFPHMDAVLFNLGMILSDDGQADGMKHLTRLVEEYPDSPNVQEAWLRMGSDLFDRKDYAGCVPMFEHAATGDDASFRAIALYKLGWAQFEEDRFSSSADAFRRLTDLYAEHPDVARAMDLRDEAEEYFVHALARSGGAEAFRDYFDSIGGREYESEILLSLGHLMGSVSLYEEAVACDELYLERYPLDGRAVSVAERMAATYRRWNKPDQARESKLAAAGRFLPGTDWYRANDDDELRARGLEFAQGAYRENAAHYHKEARTTDRRETWEKALSSYEVYLEYWPKTADAPNMHYLAGETASRLERYPLALDHFATAAASDTFSQAVEAAWQHVAVTDAWYRSVPTDTSATRRHSRSDSLGVLLLRTGRDFVSKYPDDQRCPDVYWRAGNVAYAHGWYEQAAASLGDLGERYPGDERALRAVRMSGDARYRLSEYDLAGQAYEKTVEMARAAGEDSIVTALLPTIPLCYYKHAERIADGDGGGVKKAAPLFADVAHRWPGFEHRDLALYRAGLGFAEDKKYTDAATVWDELLSQHPNSEYARDSAIQIAMAHEKSGQIQSAARAYERFSRIYREDPDAPEALLKATDLLVEANDREGAEDMRDIFLERFPDEIDVVMEIRTQRAKREMERVTGGTSSLKAALAPVAVAGAVVGAGANAARPATAPSELQEYLDLAAQHPELADPVILAEVDFYTAEEAYPDYAQARLTQPLPESIEAKKAKLESMLELYGKCTQHNVAEYSRASAYRIGQVLIEFGDALIASERPDGLSEDDRLAYDEVIEEQAWGFYDRGEDVWTELLQQVGEPKEDPGEWIARTRERLWPRLAQRFLHRPEVDYPLVAATPPAETDAN